jgi:hypothetical protein
MDTSKIFMDMESLGRASPVLMDNTMLLVIFTVFFGPGMGATSGAVLLEVLKFTRHECETPVSSLPTSLHLRTSQTSAQGVQSHPVFVHGRQRAWWITCQLEISIKRFEVLPTRLQASRHKFIPLLQTPRDQMSLSSTLPRHLPEWKNTCATHQLVYHWTLGEGEWSSMLREISYIHPSLNSSRLLLMRSPA